MVIAPSAINASQVAGADQLLSSVASRAVSTGDISSSENAVPFSNLLRETITTTQKLQDDAADKVEGLMTGTGVDVHQAMIATQKADIAFELTMAVRNKAVAAYQQMMGMQF